MGLGRVVVVVVVGAVAAGSALAGGVSWCDLLEAGGGAEWGR